ncbi:hypothetical protein J4573_47410 [Actinomadura barringtoniae]|uniref:Uncharacterized protein n=1 Tax=Actinomadura barringtoniae TaxID=1427535 RepID=A0A939PR93_9ACTN|nr:hypothetical protein [Actinomadura barringtoniae]MBO2454788.1 hypothetical protein [Actinomadura barringtoniae]
MRLTVDGQPGVPRRPEDVRGGARQGDAWQGSGPHMSWAGDEPDDPWAVAAAQASWPSSGNDPRAGGPGAGGPGVQGEGRQDAWAADGPEEGSTSTGPIGLYESSGVQVRLRSSGSHARVKPKSRAKPRRGRRRLGLGIAVGLVGLAAVAAGGTMFALRGSDDAPAAKPAAAGPAPKSGAAVDVGTSDGSKYEIKAVTGGTNEGVVETVQSSPLPSGSAFAYIDYVLSNPSNQKVLLDYPADVFVRKSLVAAQARGRCMWQAGVPENMCTPPTTSDVVRRLAGGALQSGDGGDRYMPPGSSFLVRATVQVPVDKRLRQSDLRLYIWKQLYMDDQTAKLAPFPTK